VSIEYRHGDYGELVGFPVSDLWDLLMATDDCARSGWKETKQRQIFVFGTSHNPTMNGFFSKKLITISMVCKRDIIY
jgi:hypothetical protein